MSLPDKLGLIFHAAISKTITACALTVHVFIESCSLSVSSVHSNLHTSQSVQLGCLQASPTAALTDCGRCPKAPEQPTQCLTAAHLVGFQLVLRAAQVDNGGG